MIALRLAMEGGFCSEMKSHSLFLQLKSFYGPLCLCQFLKVRFTSSLNQDKQGTYGQCLACPSRMRRVASLQHDLKDPASWHPYPMQLLPQITRCDQQDAQ